MAVSGPNAAGLTNVVSNATAMFGDGRINKVSGGPELRERAVLVAAHQTAESGDIRRQYSRQPPFDPPACQKMRLG